MTNEERWKVEGRTRDDLREAKKNVTALKIEIEEFVNKLADVNNHIRRFLANPVGSGPTGMTSRQYTLHFFRDIVPADIQSKLAEFETESERVRDLEIKVKEFD